MSASRNGPDGQSVSVAFIITHTIKAGEEKRYEDWLTDILTAVNTAPGYLGSKGAIEQFVGSLSRELGPCNVTVNALSPGFTDTDMLLEHYREYGAAQSPFQSRGRAGGRGRRGRFSCERRGTLDHRAKHPGRRRRRLRTLACSCDQR